MKTFLSIRTINSVLLCFIILGLIALFAAPSTVGQSFDKKPPTKEPDVIVQSQQAETGDYIVFSKNTGNYFFVSCSGVAVKGTAAVTVTSPTEFHIQHVIPNQEVLVAVDTATGETKGYVKINGVEYNVQDLNIFDGIAPCQ